MIRSSPRFVDLSPPTARKPVLKRRRLNVNSGIDSGFQSRALTDNSNVFPMPNAPPPASLYAKLSCSTCHRALSAAIRPGVPGAYTICSRCSAPTCAICSRTCTSYTRPPSFPPTPALTRSPSPSAHVATPISPKRAAMNCDASALPPPPPSHTLPSIKRKKSPVDKDADVDSDPDGAGRFHHHRYHYGSGMFASIPGDVCCNATDSVVVPGCGRVVCRACCIESIPNDGKLCVDCFALV